MVEQARSGDAGAFRRLVEKYQDRVFGLAVRVAGREEADEVAQDVFLRVWRALPRFRNDARFSTWLYSIAYRRSCDALGSARTRRHRERDLDTAGAVASPSPPERDPRARRIGQLVASLSEAQRAAITLFYYQDQTLADVALTLGMPEGTVKTHLHRARAALRRAFESPGEREVSDGLHER